MRPLTSPLRSAASRKPLVAALLMALVGLPGCWEQVSVEWFPQMKWQPAVQAYELNPFQDRISLFAPPDGTVPVGWGDIADPATIRAKRAELLAQAKSQILTEI